ncbi:MAG TPA: MBL fold metallo-hydrolase [Bacillota bacterium]|nr:MBL fold metallo-hydrolase [Bacillota bacterium]
MEGKVIKVNFGFVNSFIIEDQGRALVDTGINLAPDRFEKVFNELKIDPKTINLIIITHGHSDHFAHIKQLQEMTGARILCHEKAAPFIRTGENAEVVPRNWVGRIMMTIFRGKLKNYQPVEPDILIDEPFDLHDFGVRGTIVPTPGHTDCSISVLLDWGDAIVGDIMMGSPHQPDRPLPAVFANDEKAIAESMRFLLNSNATQFFGGHAGPFTKEAMIKRFDKVLEA